MPRKTNSRSDRTFRIIVAVLVVSAVMLIIALAVQSHLNSREEASAITAGGLLTAGTAEPLTISADGIVTVSEPDATPEPTEAPQSAPVDPNALPVYTRGRTDDPVIAITLDDCTNIAALNYAIESAKAFDARLTLFPIGSRITENTLSSILKTCVLDLGYEVENRTWNNHRLYGLDLIDMAKDIWGTDVAMDYVLNMQYGMHLLRPNGGVGTSDPRTNAYLKQLGYDGYLTWSVNGSATSLNDLYGTLAPGEIYLFTCNETEVKKMVAFLQFASNSGFRVVTASELLGFGAIRCTDSDIAILSQVMPVPEEYEMLPVEFSRGDRAWQVKLIQERLIELGYLASGEADGVFGGGTSRAIMNFQAQYNIPCTGIATWELQQALFSEDAMRAPKGLAPVSSATQAPAAR